MGEQRRPASRSGWARIRGTDAAQPRQLRAPRAARRHARHRLAVDARHLRRAGRRPRPDPARRHGRVRPGHRVRRPADPAPGRARPARRGRDARRAGVHRVRRGARAVAGARRVRPARRLGRHDGRRPQHRRGPDRPAAAAQPAARRLRRRHRDRPAGRHRRHPDRFVAARLPGPGRPRPGHGRAVAAPSQRQRRLVRAQAGTAEVAPAVTPDPHPAARLVPAPVHARW